MEAGNAPAGATPGARFRMEQAGQKVLSRTGAAPTGDLPAQPAGIHPAQGFAPEGAVPDSTQPVAASATGSPAGSEAAGPIQLIPSGTVSAIDAAQGMPGRDSGTTSGTVQHPAGSPAAPPDAAHPTRAENAPFAPAPSISPAGPPPGNTPSRVRSDAKAGSGQVGGAHSAATQPGSADPWASGVAHLSGGDPGGLNAVNAAPHRASGIGGEAGPVGSQDTFAGLDAGSSASRLAWIHAGAQHAEAGFNDPALGWVGVRADLAGGVVHAALVPGSADAAQALSGHIAGLNAHLAEHRIPVEALSMATAAGRDLSGGPNQGSANHPGQGSSQQGGAGEFEAEHRVPAGSGSGILGSLPATDWATAMPDPSLGLTSSHSIAAVRHISVIA